MSACCPPNLGSKRGGPIVGPAPSELALEMVVLPTVVVRVVELSLTVLTMALVDTAVALPLDDSLPLLVDEADCSEKTNVYIVSKKKNKDAFEDFF